MSQALSAGSVLSKRPILELSETPSPQQKKKRSNIEPLPEKELALTQLARKRLARLFPTTPRELHGLWPRTLGLQGPLRQMLDGGNLALAESCAQLALYVEQDCPQYMDTLVKPLLLHCLSAPHEKRVELVALALDAVAHQSSLLLNSLPHLALEQWHSALREDCIQRLGMEVETLIRDIQPWNALDFQNPMHLPARLLPLLLTQHLLPKAQLINFGMAEVLIETLKFDHGKAARWRRYDAHLMRLMGKDRRLRDTLRKIQAPHRSLASSQLVIRQSLFMNPKEPIQEVHAQRAALSALLSRLYQRATTGSCAGTASGIRLLAHYPQMVLVDFKALLEDGFMERHFAWEHRAYPIKAKLSPDTALAEYPLNLKEVPIWELPSIQVAVRALGMEPNQDLFQRAANLLGEPKKLSPKNLFKALIQVSGQEDEHHDLLHHMIFLYESYSTHPLMRAWEYNLLSLGWHLREFQDSLSNVTAIALLDLADAKLKKVSEANIEAPEDFLESFLSAFRGQITSRCCYLFDPCYHTDQSQNNTAACVLHDRKGSRNPSSWTAVNNPQRFRALMLEIVEDSFKAMPKAEDAAEAEAWRLAAQSMLDAVKSEAFLHACLAMTEKQSIMKAGQDVAENLKNPEFLENGGVTYSSEQIQRVKSQPFYELANTPWTLTGGNEELIMTGYLESLKAIENSTRWYHGSAATILCRAIRHIQDLPPATQSDLAQNPFSLLPAHASLHAVTLTAGHPSFKEAWMSRQDASTWMKDKLETPFRSIPKSPLSQASREGLLKGVLWHGAEEKKESFMEAAKEIPERLPCKEYRNKLASVLYHHRKHQEHQLSECAELVDIHLFHNLPHEQKEAIQASAVLMSHVSHGGSEFDDYLAVALNPGTGKLSFWRSKDNGDFMEIEDSAEIWHHWQFSNPIPKSG